MINAAESLSGQVIDGRYGVECCIGRGGMGIVWRVRQVETGQLFALKTLKPQALQSRKMLRRLLHEARATAAVQSHNVVRVVDVKPDYVHQGADLPFIVMELLEGQSFSDFLQTHQRLEPSQLVWVMRQVSHGLSLAHRLGIIHRDLKPANVFLARDDEGRVVVKLCDFGIAKLQGQALIDLAETGTLPTETGVVFGTPRYMAPEQLRRAGREGPQTDQWAFALIAFRALGGHGYFETARNVAELILAIVHEPLPIPSSLSVHVPPAFDAWFFRSCARDPADRFLDVETQQLEFERALGSPPPLPLELPAQSPNSVSLLPQGQPRSESSSAADNVEDSSWARIQRNRSLLTPFYFSLGAATLIAFAGTAWLREKLQPRRDTLVASGLSRAVMTNSITTQQLAATATTAQPALVRADAGTTATSPSSPHLPAPLGKKSSTIRKFATPETRTERSQGPAATHLLPRGAPCARSAQCADGLCAAEVCQ